MSREFHPSKDPAIRVEGLSKSFGSLVALDKINLEVRAGAIGLLGPNGAGKSTLIKCLLQQQTIDEGNAWLLGREVGTEGREIRRRIGYNPEQDCHIPGMVGCEYVTYCAQLSGLPFRAARQRAHEMLDFVGMGQERYRKVDTYSTGMKQRLKLAQAIVHDPDLVFLDEPTNGLDPKGQEHILRLISELWRSHRISVVLSSHLMHDVDRVCEQIIIIARGKILVHDSIEKLKSQRKGAAEVYLESGRDRALKRFQEMHWQAEGLPNGRIRVEHGGLSLNPIVDALAEVGLKAVEVLPSPNALEELFVQALATE